MAAPKALRLLLVDDDSAQCRLLAHMLRSGIGRKVEVIETTDPQAALAELESTWVDILVTDLNMPLVRGLDLVHAARQRNPAVQSLVLTASSTWDELIQAIELGATDYLLKPVAPDLLVELVRQAEERLGRWRAALAGTFEQRRQRAEAIAG